MALTDLVSTPDPGQASPAPVGFWDNLLSLSQRSAARGVPPGLGGLVGQAIGGRYAPGVGFAFDLLGQAPLPQMPGRPPLPQGRGMASLGSILGLAGLL